jgi:hypothetical protein
LIVKRYLTIDAPLILKTQDIILFLRANYIMGHWQVEQSETSGTAILRNISRGPRRLFELVASTQCTFK